MAEDIIFNLEASGSSVIDELRQIYNALSDIGNELQNLYTEFAVFNDLDSVLASLAENANKAVLSLQSLDKELATMAQVEGAAGEAAATVVQAFQDALAAATGLTQAQEEIAKTAQDVATAEEAVYQATALTDEEYALQEEEMAVLAEQQATLADALTFTAQAAAQLSLPLSDDEIALQNAGIASEVLAQNIANLDNAFMDGLVSEQEYNAQMQELGVSVTNLDGTLAEGPTVIGEIGNAIDSLSGQIEASIVELQQYDAAWAEGLISTTDWMNATLPLVDEIDNARQAIAAYEQQIQSLTPTVADIVTAEQEQTQAFNDIAAAASPAADALNQVAQASDTIANSLTAADEVEAEFAISTDTLRSMLNELAINLGDADAAIQTMASDLGMSGQEFVSMVGDVDAATRSQLAFIQAVNLIEEDGGTLPEILTNIAAAASQTGVGFNTMTQAIFDASNALAPANGEMIAVNVLADELTMQINNLAESFNFAASAVMSLIPGMGSLYTAEEAATVATDELTAAQDAQAASAHGNYFMEMMLAQMVLSVAGSFLQQGMAAQDAIAHLTGLADQTLATAQGQAQLNTVINQLSADSMKYGVALADAANGMYFIESAGFSTSQAVQILNYSMEASAATGTKMQTVSSAITSVLNAYAMSASQAGYVTNILVSGVVAAKATFDTFATAIGPVAASAHHAGVSIGEATAALATLTQINPRIRQDGTDLSHLFDTLSTKVDTTAKNAAALGISFDKNAYESMNLIEKLQYLAKIAGGDTTPAFQKLLTDQTSARAAFDLLSNSGKLYASELQKVTGNTHALDIAFQQSESTISASLGHIGAALSVISYRIVVMITPAAKAVLDAFNTALSYLAQHMEILVPIVSALAVLLGGLLIGALRGLVIMFAGMVGPAMAIAVPLALIVGVVVALIPAFQRLFATSAPVRTAIGEIGNALSGTLRWLQQIGTYLAGAFFPAMSSIGGLFQKIGQDILTNFVPPLGSIITQFILFGNRVLSNVIPALISFGAYINTNVLPPLQTIITNIIKFGGAMLTAAGPGIQVFLNDLLRIGGYIMQNVLPPIGQFIATVLRIAAQVSGSLGPVFQQLGNIFLAIRATGIAATITSIGMAIAPMIPVVAGIVVEFATGLLPAIQAILAIATPFIAAFIAANAPFLLITAAVALLIIGLVKLFGPLNLIGIVIGVVMTALRALWSTLVATLHPALQELWGIIQSQLIPAWMHLMTALAPLLPQIEILAKFIGGVLVVIFGILISILGGVITAFVEFVVGLARIITGVVQFISGLMQIFTGFFTWLAGLLNGNKAEQDKGWNAIKTGVTDIVKGLGNMIVGIFQAFLGAIIGFVNGFINTIIQFFTHLKDVLVGHSIWPDMLTAMLDHFTSWVSSIFSAVGNFINSIISYFTNLGERMKLLFTMYWSAIQVIWQVVLDAIKALLSGHFQQFLTLISGAGEMMISLIDHATGGMLTKFVVGFANIMNTLYGWLANVNAFFGGIPGQMLTWGIDMMQGLANGIMQGLGAVGNAVNNVVGFITSHLHFSKPDVGPLADYETWMPDFMQGLADGMNNNVHIVSNAARNVAGAISGAVPQPSNFAGYMPQQNNQAQTVQVLQAILTELQQQRQMRGSNALGHGVPSATIGTVNSVTNNNYASNNAVGSLYQQLNTLSGIANEYGTRGATSGLGI